MDTVLDKLKRCRQRATYGAVAVGVGCNPRNVVKGRPRTPRHSWVVNKGTRQPTGYSDEKKHPELSSRAKVIEEAGELEQWLGKPD